jgi:hypothetical protein
MVKLMLGRHMLSAAIMDLCLEGFPADGCAAAVDRHLLRHL